MRTLRHFAFLALVTPTFATPEDYNCTSGYGYFNSAATNSFFEVEITSATLVGDVTEPDGRRRLSFNFGVRNIGGGYQEGVQVLLDDPATLPWAAEVVTPAAAAGDLAPGSPAAPSVASTSSPLAFIVAAADADSAKAAILARDHIHATCRDLYRFTVPVRAADAAMDAAFTGSTSSGGLETLIFSTTSPSLTTLSGTTLLVHNPEVYELRQPAFTGEEVLRHHLTNTAAADGQFVATRVPTRLFQVSSVLVQPDGSVHVSGTSVRMIDLLSSGVTSATQLDGYRDGRPDRDPYNPPDGTTFHTPAEHDMRHAPPDPDEIATGFPAKVKADIFGFFTLHYPFNDVEIIPGVTLDGQVLLRGLSVRMDVVKRDGQCKKIAYRVTNRFEASLRLTAEAEVELFDTSKTIISTSLPTVIVPVFEVPITIRPVFTVKVGAEADVSGRIQVPIHGAFESGFVMKYDLEKDGANQLSFDPISHSIPMEMSKPSLSEALHLHAKAWVGASMDLIVQETAGPGIELRAWGDLNVRPLDSPWWTLDGDWELRGRLAVNILGFALGAVDIPLVPLPDLFHRDAGGPHTPSGTNGPLAREEGAHVRWARAARWTNQSPYAGKACRVAGTAEDVFVVMNSYYPSTALMRLDGLGNLAWVQGITEPLQHIAATPDGGVILSGCQDGANGVRLIKYDTGGNRQWEKRLVLNHSDSADPQLYVARILARDAGGGGQELHILGWRYRNLNSGIADPFLIRCDGNGNVLGVKSYDSADLIQVRDAVYTADGGIVWAGLCQRSPDGVQLPSALDLAQGWLMKTDLQGNLLWTNSTGSGRGNYFNSVTTSPDGEIYTCGMLFTVYGTGYGSMQLTRHSADGSLQRAVTLSEGTDSPTINDYAFIPSHSEPTSLLNTNPTSPYGAYTSWLPDSGRTEWDEGRRIAWTPNGILVVSTSGLSSSRAATIACLTEELSARWFTAHEREGSEEWLFDVLPTADGVLAIGSSASLLQFKTQASTGNECAVFLKLPWEGKCDLHPGTRSIHRYLQPGIHDHRNNETELGPYQPSITTTATFSLTVVDSSVRPGDPLYAHQFIAVPVSDWVALEAGDANRPVSYTQWATYWNLPAGSAQADADGDGRTNGQEWFFGGNPSTNESGANLLTFRRLPGNHLSITFTKSNASSLHLPRLESSTNLSNWDVMEPLSITTIPGDSVVYQKIEFTFALPSEAKRFYRIASP